MSSQRPSKLEQYVEVLKALGENEALNIGVIASKTGIDRVSVVLAIDFLEKQTLVQSTVVKGNILYRNTARGIRVFKFLGGVIKLPNEEIVDNIPLQEKDEAATL